MKARTRPWLRGIFFLGLIAAFGGTFWQIQKEKGEHSLQPKMTRHSNRLIREKSPYLLQHADNPVDWYPWGEEAFERARREEKPIFLSIGYSTCHWCHVMERESFENPEVAALLNRHFVSIKVDREELVAVDNLYMQAVIQMTGQGGWPLSVFLTPERKPFYGGTYFPPEDRWGQPGFKSVLRGVAKAWEQRREELVRSGEELTRVLGARPADLPTDGGPLTKEVLIRAVEHYRYEYDERYGGFGSAPKFPRGHGLSFLLRHWKRTGDPDALRRVEATLQAMAAGGIWDHVGFGFHRYSTDAEWFLPHFEKMLYDQAILSKAYLEAYQATGNETYARVAQQIFTYVLRDLTSPEGAFYSAEDADSEPAEVPGTGTVPGTDFKHAKKEGAFYLWAAEELRALLGEERYVPFAKTYGVEPSGNVRQDPTGEFRGKNLLALREREGMEEAVREILFEARAKRPRPHRDDKVLADWNGLMISALALGAQVLEEPEYAQAAQRAADFLLQKMVQPDGRLLHRYRQGEVGIPGTLEDYAFFVHGLVDLYEATFQPAYLEAAQRLTREMVRLFWDEEGAGFFLSAAQTPWLLVRQKEVYDGAIPSGNSIAALDLLRVGRLTADSELEAKAGALFGHFAGQVTQTPSAYPQLLVALDFALGPSYEIVIAGQPQAPDTQAMLREVRRAFLPNKVVVLHPSGRAGEAVEALVPFVKGQVAMGGRATAYVCQNYACRLPTTEVHQLKELLHQ